MAGFEVLTAEEFLALDVEGRGPDRRAARETPLLATILRLFLERGGPIPVEVIVTAVEERSREAVRDALETLDEDDLVRVRDGNVDIAYPFSAAPTAFVVRLADGRERYTCCALDALGIAPMVGQPVQIIGECHHCGKSFTFSATPQGPGPEAAGIMVWVGKRTDARCKVADSL